MQVRKLHSDANPQMDDTVGPIEPGQTRAIVRNEVPDKS